MCLKDSFACSLFFRLKKIRDRGLIMEKTNFEGLFKKGIDVDDATHGRVKGNLKLRKERREKKLEQLRDINNELKPNTDQFNNLTNDQIISATHETLKKIFHQGNTQIILNGLYDLAFLTYTKASHNFFKVQEVILKDSQNIINRLLSLLKTTDKNLSEHVEIASKCLAHLSSASGQFDKEMIQGGLIQAFQFHVPKNPNKAIQKQLIWTVINVMTIKRVNAEICLIQGNIHKTFEILPDEDMEYVCWFFNAALVRHRPPFDWQTYCEVLWRRVEAVVVNMRDPRGMDPTDATFLDALMGIEHVSLRPVIFQKKLTPALFNTLLSIASLDPNRFEDWVGLSVAILSRVCFEEYPKELVLAICDTRAIVETSLPHMLRSPKGKLARDAVFLCMNAVILPECARRLSDLLETIAERLYHGQSCSEFNSFAVETLNNAIRVLVPLDDQVEYFHLFSTGTIVTALVGRLSFPDPDCILSILQTIDYLVTRERQTGQRHVQDQLIDRDTIQVISNLAYSSTFRNERIEQVAMKLLTVSEVREDATIEMEGVEEFYF